MNKEDKLIESIFEDMHDNYYNDKQEEVPDNFKEMFDEIDPNDIEVLKKKHERLSRKRKVAKMTLSVTVLIAATLLYNPGNIADIRNSKVYFKNNVIILNNDPETMTELSYGEYEFSSREELKKVFYEDLNYPLYTGERLVNNKIYLTLSPEGYTLTENHTNANQMIRIVHDTRAKKITIDESAVIDRFRINDYDVLRINENEIISYLYIFKGSYMRLFFNNISQNEINKVLYSVH